ncbi:hypothetical protein Dimus_032564 [Dionaea muscipula]
MRSFDRVPVCTIPSTVSAASIACAVAASGRLQSFSLFPETEPQPHHTCLHLEDHRVGTKIMVRQQREMA